jgi:hypothetical protein
VRADGGASGAILDHPERRLVRLSNGGFEIEATGCPAIRVEASGEVWSVDGVEGLPGGILRRATSGGEGFVLEAARGRTEAGRTMPLVGAGREAGLKFLLLDDGRLFRVVRRGPRKAGFELLGWEMPGAYLTAQPAPEGWRLIPTAASGGLEDLTRLVVLFAAEILDAEEPLRPEVI